MRNMKNMPPRIGVLGSYDAEREPRKMIGVALEHSASALGISVVYEWLDNAQITFDALKRFDGFFIAPGSAFEDSTHILEAIKFAREKRIPCLGTCGGFQRILTEYALNVLGFEQIEHQEALPDAVDPLFSALQCAISSTVSEIVIEKHSNAFTIYQQESIFERHYCHFGLNPKYAPEFLRAGMRISGTDRQGIARIVELNDHPFFMGTLFVPQVSSTLDSPHPMISAFLTVVVKRSL